MNEEHIPITQEVEERPTIPVVRELFLLAVLLLLVFGTAVTPSYVQKAFLDKGGDENSNSVQTASVQQATEDTKPFEEMTITGRAAYVWDINNQRVLYKKNESTRLPLASVTKLMTALVAQELLDEKEQVAIADSAINQEGDSGLFLGELFDRLTLSDLTLMSSSNDGAYALALSAGALLSSAHPAEAFVQAMNIRAEEIGLSDTHFRNPTGLDISETESGGYGTARDMAFLMEYIVQNYPDILTYTSEETARVYNETGAFHDAENTNYYTDAIPGLIGSKTGYTDLAGGNLVIAFDAGLNRPVVIAVLGSTAQDRFNDVLTLVSETQRYVANE